MGNDAYKRTAVGQARDVDSRLSGLESRLAMQPSIPTVLPVQGTSAARDDRFGVPATDAERVALANERAIWFNDDFGWLEGYYAEDGLTDLTARGLVAGTVSGWYPVSLGPRLTYSPVAQAATPGGGAHVGGWAGETWVNGAGWFSYNDATGEFTMVNAGRYRIAASIVLQTGEGTADFYLHVGAVFRNSGQTISPTAFLPWREAFNNVGVAAGGTAKVTLISGPLDIFMNSGGVDAPSRGEFTIEYLGPALVSD